MSRGFTAVRGAAHPAPVRCSDIGAGSWGSKGGAAPPCQTAMFNRASAGLRTLRGGSQRLQLRPAKRSWWAG